MRICFVGQASSVHLAKWCGWFSAHGYEVHAISFVPGDIPGAQVHVIDTGTDADGSDFGKLKYLTAGGRIRKLIAEIRPDIVNVHYATSYGTAAALGGIRGHVLSVWGSDVYDFPRKSLLHRAVLKYSLRKAACIFSTSRAMAEETSRYTKKRIEVTPFGVDTELFSPERRTRPRDGKEFVIGTVKGLYDKYGIADILRAAAIVRREHAEIPLKVRIAGKGPQETAYRKLAAELGIGGITEWMGSIPQEQAAAAWADMDVAVIPSVLESESFGVAAVEAQACGTPVIISDVPGLMEATEPGKSSVVVHRNHPEEIAEKIAWFHENRCAEAYGQNGRRFVLEHYEINRCFSETERILIRYMK